MSFRYVPPLPDPDEVSARLLIRWYRLRQLGKQLGRQLVPPLLNVAPHVYVFDSAVDPWGTKRKLKTEELEEMVEKGEMESKKPVVSADSLSPVNGMAGEYGVTGARR